MRKITEIKSKCLRRERNADLLKRMRSGEQLSSFNSYASWFPPRPIIQKDATALQELYGEEAAAAERMKHAELDEAAMKPLRLA